MKYKILLNIGNQILMQDIYVQMNLTFECMTTSGNREDIRTHFKYFKPHGYLIFEESITLEEISKLRKFKKTMDDTKLFIMANDETCMIFNEAAPDVADILINKSDSVDSAKEKIREYLNNVHTESTSAEAKTTENTMVVSNNNQKTTIVPPYNSESISDMQTQNSVNDTRKLIQPLENIIEDTKKNILIVDDDKTILKMLKQSLKDDYNVTAVTSGKIAIKYLQTKPAELILLDYEMPDEKGTEVYKKILQDERLKDIPVVFLTGVNERDKIHEVLLLHPRGYLLKPIDISALKKTITSIVG